MSRIQSTNISLKSVTFIYDLRLNQRLYKSLDLQDCKYICLKDNCIEFSHNSKIFLVPLSNISLMERV